MRGVRRGELLRIEGRITRKFSCNVLGKREEVGFGEGQIGVRGLWGGD